MNRECIVFSFVLMGILLPFTAKCQDSRIATQPVSLQVASSALLSIAGPAVTLTLGGAKEAGDAIDRQSDNIETRLRISSLVSNDESRAITAKISEELVGTQLYIQLQDPNSNFQYPENKGTLKGEQLLSSVTDATLVEGIGTCWSGKEEGDGYVIKYIFRAIPKAPILKSADITVTYTISLVASDSGV